MPMTLGYATRAGLRREAITTATSWPAASPALVSALLPILEAEPNLGPEKTGTRTTNTPYAPVAYDLTTVAPSLNLPLQLRYQGLEEVWALALGFMARRISGNLMPQTLATGAYRHLYEIDRRLGAEAWVAGDGWLGADGLLAGQRKVRRATIAIDYGWGVLELLSSMVAGWTLSASHGGVILSLDLAGHSVSTGSATNTTTTLRLLAPPSAARLTFTQAVCRIAPFSASTALNSGNEIKVTSWALRVDNHLATSFSKRMNKAPEEYERTQAPTVTLTLVAPRIEAATWASRWNSNDILMADMKFTGSAIGGTGHNYQCHVYLPSLQVSNDQPPITGPGVMGETVQLLGITPSASAAGFPAMHHLGPVAVELVNASNVHPLV